MAIEQEVGCRIGLSYSKYTFIVMTEIHNNSPGEPLSEDVISHAKSLRTEAKQTHERRLIVLAGNNETGLGMAQGILENVDIPSEETTFVGSSHTADWECIDPRNADELLGTTRSAIVFDTHDALFPNALGRVFGAVDGGGLLVFITPPLDEWPDRRDSYDESLAAPPYDVEDVTGHFKSRVIEKLRSHSGITIIDVNSQSIRKDGHTNPTPEVSEPLAEVVTNDKRPTNNAPVDNQFPDVAYEACLTKDQADAVATFENLLVPGRAVVLEADRGRGKSSAAGIAAGVLAARGETVAVTSPGYRSAREIFKRARELLSELNSLGSVEGSEDAPCRLVTHDATNSEKAYYGDSLGGSVSFVKPAEIEEAIPADIFIVDEAAAFPVETLDHLLDVGRVAFATTIHGYEGAGRGFSVRFRSRLRDSNLTVEETELDEPIRYAENDPVESFAYQTLALNASPPSPEAVTGATTENAVYRKISSNELTVDDGLLEEVIGLLVQAHYKTEPDDLVRILDAPDVSVRGLFHNGHVVSVLYFATEGELSVEDRTTLYEGERIPGHLVPEILITKLRDKEACKSPGIRLRRLTTHHALRSKGLGSTLVENTHKEFDKEVDWFAGGYGTTPKLASFWAKRGYDAVQMTTSRQDASGEYSVLMLRSTSDTGERLRERHNRWFSRRIASKLSDSLTDLNPDVARPLLRTIDSSFPLNFNTHDWHVVAGAANGLMKPKIAPRAFRRLTLRYFAQSKGEHDEVDSALELSPQEERLLVSRVLQGNDWKVVLDQTEYSSKEDCKQAQKNALKQLVDYYGGEMVQETKHRFSD